MSYVSYSPMHSGALESLMLEAAGRSGGLGRLFWPGSGPTRDCSHVGWLGRGCPDAQSPLGHMFFFETANKAETLIKHPLDHFLYKIGELELPFEDDLK